MMVTMALKLSLHVAQAQLYIYVADDDSLPVHLLLGKGLTLLQMFSADAAMEIGPLAVAIQTVQAGDNAATPFPDDAEEALLQASKILLPQTDREAAVSPYAHKWHASDMTELGQVIDKGV